MFDYHIHTRVSFDGKQSAQEALAAAEAAGLREICFTDHVDYDPGNPANVMAFSNEDYHKAYDNLKSDRVKIRRGMEFGLTTDNQSQLKKDLARRNFDFVLGSIHFVEGRDVYFAPYWQGKTQEQAERIYLETTLACVECQEDYDVLAHLTYIGKAPGNVSGLPVLYANHRTLVDEILRVLAKKGKGLELNTSGRDRCGAFLPDEPYFRRFRELGGEIVTIGSDAHSTDRVGQYTPEACRLLKDIFGHVCTFENRQVRFHQL